MRTRDLIGTALGGLWRQKARSALTLLGVAVGATALAYTLALGVGLREFIENEFKSRREFWTVRVTPIDYGRPQFPEADIPPEEVAVSGDLPADRRERLRKRLVLDYQRDHPPKKLSVITKEQVERMKRMPGVEAVQTFQVGSGEITVGDSRRFGSFYCGKLDAFDPPLADMLLWGRMPTPGATDEVVVSEFLLYALGFKTDEQMRGVVGKPVRVTVGGAEFSKGIGLAAMLSPNARQEQISRAQAEVLDRIAKQLPQHIDKFDLSDFEKLAVKAVLSAKPPPADAPKRHGDQTPAEPIDFTIVGVSRLPDDKPPDPTDLLAGSPAPHNDLMVGPEVEEKLFAKRLAAVGLSEIGYSDVSVRVTPGGDVEGVVNEIEGMGLHTYNSLRYYNGVKREVTLISAGLNLFAMLSMLVAAIGIMNTLFTSVLERTREIGILKAVGARDGHILWVFLLEGAAVGLVGGLLGLGAAWALSIPSDGWVKSLIESVQKEKLLTTTYFAWPWWLVPAVLLFTVLLTTAAAVFPARRASRIPPVEALRYE
jgi:putative ABC transport system permease protein